MNQQDNNEYFINEIIRLERELFPGRNHFQIPDWKHAIISIEMRFSRLKVIEELTMHRVEGSEKLKTYRTDYIMQYTNLCYLFQK